MAEQRIICGFSPVVDSRTLPDPQIHGAEKRWPGLFDHLRVLLDEHTVNNEKLLDDGRIISLLLDQLPASHAGATQKAVLWIQENNDRRKGSQSFSLTLIVSVKVIGHWVESDVARIRGTFLITSKWIGGKGQLPEVTVTRLHDFPLHWNCSKS